jgi:hypothetical protein
MAQMVLTLSMKSTAWEEPNAAHQPPAKLTASLPQQI